MLHRNYIIIWNSLLSLCTIRIVILHNLFFRPMSLRTQYTGAMHMGLWLTCTQIIAYNRFIVVLFMRKLLQISKCPRYFVYPPLLIRYLPSFSNYLRIFVFRLYVIVFLLSFTNCLFSSFLCRYARKESDKSMPREEYTFEKNGAINLFGYLCWLKRDWLNYCFLHSLYSLKQNKIERYWRTH